jgi:hypothetical protein
MSDLPFFDDASPKSILHKILEWLEEKIDLKHLATVEQRHIQTLEWQPVDYLPVTILAPVVQPFRIYPYQEVINNPTKMMVNELVGPYGALGSTASVVNSVLLQDDFPLQIRANYGVGLMASLFGAECEITGDGFTWARPIGPQECRKLLGHGLPNLKGGLLNKAMETMSYYKEVLTAYPKCSQSIKISQPDLQGPYDIATQLYGGDIFTLFYDDPIFLREYLDLIAETYLVVCRKFDRVSTGLTKELYRYLHYTILKGHAILKDDSSVMLSPKIYANFIRPANEKILLGLGDGCIHFCGRGDQWRDEFIQTKGLIGVDFGQLYLNDITAWASHLRRKYIPIVNADWVATTSEINNVYKLFSSGISIALVVDNLEEGRRFLTIRNNH